MSNRVTEQENRLTAQGKLLAEREYENNAVWREAEKELRDEIAALEQRQEFAGAGKTAHREGRTGGTARRRARRTRQGAARLAAIQQQAESSWATERMENALLRERINDIAAEVAKLAMTLEGPNSAIEAILAAEPVPPKPSVAANVCPPTAPCLRASSRNPAARWPTASAPCNRMPHGRSGRAEVQDRQGGASAHGRGWFARSLRAKRKQSQLSRRAQLWIASQVLLAMTE